MSAPVLRRRHRRALVRVTSPSAHFAKARKGAAARTLADLRARRLLTLTWGHYAPTPEGRAMAHKLIEGPGYAPGFEFRAIAALRRLVRP